MLIVTHDDLIRIIQDVGLDVLMDQLIDRLHTAFGEFDAEQIKIPLRSGFDYDSPNPGLLEWMPLLDHGSRMLLKLVGYHPRNPDASQLPTILSTFSLYDATTGQALAMVDGTLPTAMRTGAASAIMTRTLAHPEAEVIGIVGCGAQAVTQLHAISRVRDIHKVLYFDVDESACDSFQDRCDCVDVQASFERATLPNVVSSADILCVATSIDVGAGPIWTDLPVKPHLHVNAVGSDFPGKIEVPKELLQRSYITPDYFDQAILEGECQQVDATIIGDEAFKLIRSSDESKSLMDQITVFDSTGWALEDYVVTNLILEHAQRTGIGTEIAKDSISDDPKSPYNALRLAVHAHDFSEQQT